MWISRDEYNRLKACEEKRDDYVRSLYWQIDQLRSERLEYMSECEEYKRKYADEVNKRLELIQYYEGFNSKSMG